MRMGDAMAIYVTARHMVGGTRLEHVARVRWYKTSGGEAGENSREDMVDWIKNQRVEAFVRGSNRTVVAGVVEASPPYLRTHADGAWTDNLLSLPTF